MVSSYDKTLGKLVPVQLFLQLRAAYQAGKLVVCQGHSLFAIHPGLVATFGCCSPMRPGPAEPSTVQTFQVQPEPVRVPLQ